MVNEFKNEKLQETLIVFNREKTDSAFRNLLDAFISTNFLIRHNGIKILLAMKRES